MPSYQAILSQIDHLDSKYVFFTSKEIRALPKILTEDEQIVGLISGYMDNRTWLAVCTNKRLIFLNRNMVFGQRQLQIPLDRIQSIDNEYGIAFGSVRVWDGASYFTIGMVLKTAVSPFVKAVQQAVADYRLQVIAAAPASPQGGPKLESDDDMVTKLERLASLREKGHLTEEEFQLQKKKLMAG